MNLLWTSFMDVPLTAIPPLRGHRIWGAVQTKADYSESRSGVKWREGGHFMQSWGDICGRKLEERRTLSTKFIFAIFRLEQIISFICGQILLSAPFHKALHLLSGVQDMRGACNAPRGPKLLMARTWKSNLLGCDSVDI